MKLVKSKLVGISNNLHSLRNKIVGGAVLASAAVCSAAPVDYLDTLSQVAEDAESKVNTAVPLFLAVAVSLLIFGYVIRVLKKSAKV